MFASVMDGSCLQATGNKVNMGGACDSHDAAQQFTLQPASSVSQHGGPAYRVTHGSGLCVDDGSKPKPPAPVPPPCVPPSCTPGGPANVTVPLSALGLGIPTHSIKVRDVWNKKDLPADTTGAWLYNRPCAHQYVCKYQSCMVQNGRLYISARIVDPARARARISHHHITSSRVGLAYRWGIAAPLASARVLPRVRLPRVRHPTPLLRE